MLAWLPFFSHSCITFRRPAITPFLFPLRLPLLLHRRITVRRARPHLTDHDPPNPGGGATGSDRTPW